MIPSRLFSQRRPLASARFNRTRFHLIAETAPGGARARVMAAARASLLDDLVRCRQPIWRCLVLTEAVGQVVFDLTHMSF